MYHYSVDQTVSYTAEDIVLFRESPFASWMERLTLENPDHGIPPDVDSFSPVGAAEPQDDLASTLHEEGKNVILVEWQADETVRRTATLAAMRHGVDFIVNGQVAVGPLSDSANLLMRTSGYSELGNYLYIPCDTQLKTTLSSAFHLCFLADLLHSLQGQQPPQMLILRGNSDVVPLQTDDHIFHYRAVKQRFMVAQRSFRKHRMPDPVESSHFGRWSDCANELLKQRALGQPEMPELDREEALPETVQRPLPSAGLSRALATAYDMDAVASTSHAEVSHVTAQATGTLAEQALMLGPEPATETSLGDGSDNLLNLEFIGSSQTPPTIGEAIQSSAPLPKEDMRMPEKLKPENPPPEWKAKAYKEPPPANLRNPTRIDMDAMPELDGGPEKTAAPFSNSLITNRDV